MLSGLVPCFERMAKPITTVRLELIESKADLYPGCRTYENDGLTKKHYSLIPSPNSTPAITQIRTIFTLLFNRASIGSLDKLPSSPGTACAHISATLHRINIDKF